MSSRLAAVTYCSLQVINSLSSVRSCCVLEGPHPQLVAVVVPAVRGASPDRFEKQAYQEMRELLPDNHVPDRIEIVEEIPVNTNGKIDLKSIKTRHCRSMQQLTFPQWRLLVTDSISSLVREEEGGVQEDHKLTDYGITSFELLHCLSSLEQHLLTDDIHTVPILYELLLTQSVSEAIRNSYMVLYSERPTSHRGDQIGAKRRLSGDKEGVPQLKKSLLSEDSFSWYRRGLININGSFQTFLLKQSTTKTTNELSCKLSPVWQVPTGGCVDSSPLVVTGCHGNTVYVGSHSGLIVAIEMERGSIKWRTQLKDRVESSIGISLCGEYVITGCYDGCIYVLHSTTGNIYWCYTTRGTGSHDPIKSSPTAHHLTGYVWFGSHDHHVYAVDIYERRVIHTIYLGGGACFGSVAFFDTVAMAIVTTLRGTVLCIDTEDGSIFWQYHCPKPIFSTPCILPNNDIACGCVNGSVYILSNNGELITQLAAQGPIFTSCTIAMTTPMCPNEFLVFSGSHDSHMYCWEKGRGQVEGYALKWKTSLDSEIYSVAMLGHVTSHMIDVLCVCTTAGTVYLLSPISGRVLTCHAFPGHIFSSPVLASDRVLVGCRDDDVHCLQVLVNDQFLNT